VSLHDLYTEIILEHYKEPHNVGEIDDADISSAGYNPSCGDDIRLFVKLKDGGAKGATMIDDIRFVGKGCAISQASASMMTDRMKGKTLQEAMELVEEFKKMITGEMVAMAPSPLENEEFEELSALKGVIKFPIRVKCATLAWNTLKGGLIEYEAKKNGHGRRVASNAIFNIFQEVSNKELKGS